MRDKARYAVQLIGCDRLLVERIRASLRRGPFIFMATDEAMEAEVDLVVLPAALLQDFQNHGDARPPVIAYGPPGLLRSAFLAGCKDYLKEPWSLEEFELRALAVLDRIQRRYLFSWGEISLIDINLMTPGGPVLLTHHESRMLQTLLRNRGAPVSREAIAYSLGVKPFAKNSRAIDMHATALRKKMRQAVPAAGHRFIQAVRGQGYMVP